ncbi:PREDICTED: ankyrin [Prunus dulcis]|uniref:PREDICTED: ankyrin n=1 Tax=Prunus dulcis TaxID=3755 RepID=A0A5E4G156_PRUDU|nr:PREDICTED: ankyrin [Prunus dulcis]
MEEIHEFERERRALDQMKGPYRWAMYEDWERLRRYYKDNPTEVLNPLTTYNDNALHLVVFAGRMDMLQFLISLIREPQMLRRALIMKNRHGNTTLHEVAPSGNLEAAVLLVDLDNNVRGELADVSYEGVLEIRNQLGETPVYRAASFGHTELVQYLVKKVGHKNIMPHLQRSSDQTSILHSAVIGQNFETALWLLKEYPDLADRKESNGLTSLQLLAQMPSAFQAKFRKSIWKMLIYKCLFNDDNIDRIPPNDLESRINQPCQSSCSKKITKFRSPGSRMMLEKMQNENSLLELTYLLIEKDYSWMTSREDDVRRDDDTNHTPLLIAARNGISEIVKKMLELHPQSVEAHNIDEQQNILHVAIMHRWLEIFKLIKKSRLITSRMAMKIDSNGNTILHQAATMRYYSADTQRLGGPALQLQDELLWMVRVKKIISPHYIMKHNRENKTAEQLFNSEHAKLLQSAQTWIKETAQSCSTVAALVATVVYAAAYTAPGGNDSNGVPVLRHSSFFFTFAVADTVSLISSLASLVTFLSILTSPLEYQDFYRSLPFRLHLGFTLLFFSLITTMLTFTATILLLIHPQKKWTTSLIFVVSFLPVPVCGLMQLPLFKGFSQGLKYIFKKITRIKISIFPVRGN